MMRRSIGSLVVGAVAVVALVALAVPATAQVSSGNQPVMNGMSASSVDAGMLQRTGPGGDLEHAVQSAGMHATVGCVTPLCSECHFLDTYNINDTYDGHVDGSELINKLTTTNALQNGQMYLITITGDMTYWGSSYWTEWEGLGSPTMSPMFPSPTSPAGQTFVGVDWIYLFAYPVASAHPNLFASGPVFLVGNNMVSLDNGATFTVLAPVTGMTYNPDHVYQFLVWGEGYKAVFVVNDQGPHSDNYGRYWICVQKVTPCGDITPPAQ